MTRIIGRILPKENYREDDSRTCPYCGTEDADQENNETEYDGDAIREYSTAWCSVCNAEWQLVTVYTYSEEYAGDLISSPDINAIQNNAELLIKLGNRIVWIET